MPGAPVWVESAVGDFLDDMGVPPPMDFAYYFAPTGEDMHAGALAHSAAEGRWDCLPVRALVRDGVFVHPEHDASPDLYRVGTARTMPLQRDGVDRVLGRVEFLDTPYARSTERLLASLRGMGAFRYLASPEKRSRFFVGLSAACDPGEDILEFRPTSLDLVSAPKFWAGFRSASGEFVL